MLWCSQFFKNSKPLRRKIPFSTAYRQLCVYTGGPSDYEEINNENIQPSSKSTPKPKLRVGSLLIGKEQESFIMYNRATVRDAITKLGSDILSATLVMDDKDTVSGIVTARDILRFIDEYQDNNPTKKFDECLKSKITVAMTPKEKMAYCGPNDTVTRCREIMFQNNIRHLPVIHEGEVLGIIGIKDIADSVLGMSVTGGNLSTLLWLSLIFLLLSSSAYLLLLLRSPF
jgi:CBS domain-containing protein